ncbi:MAG: glycosyltransferase [Rhodovibrionaceae bacterium]
MSDLKVFIGWDSREPEAYEVARFSLLRHVSIEAEVHPLKQPELRAQGLYWREFDPIASTEFTYTRFLTPHLAGHCGWALFCDSDFLWCGDVGELLELADPGKALLCVQHDHRPTETVKMDGRVQTVYPRKNWSSLMLFNCDHPANRKLTPEVANGESGKFLHRMQWLADEEIGALPEAWNWLEGWCAKPAEGPPKAIHYTRGGPWFEQWQAVDYADLWFAERALMERGGAESRPAAAGK